MGSNSNDKNIEEKFLAAHRRYADSIFRFCLFRVYDRELAKDMTQEIFMRVWRQVQRGVAVRHYQALLYQVARNIVIDHSRKKKEASLEALEAVGFNPVNEKAAVELQQRLDANEIDQLLANLKDVDRDIVAMRYLQGLTVIEIARATLRSPANVSVRLYRALRFLNKKIHPKP